MKRFKAVPYESGYLIYEDKGNWLRSKWLCVYHSLESNIDDAIKAYKKYYWAEQYRTDTKPKEKKFTI